MSDDNTPDITTLTVQLLSAFVSNNTVPGEGLADLIRTTRAALTENPAATLVEAQATTYTPAVSARKSLSSPDHILSMIDGKPYKTLKRHLATHGLSPDQYRERYNLPKSYPLVAPSYSEARRAVATRLGLGRKPVTTAKAAPAEKPITKASVTKAAAPAAKTPTQKSAKPAAKAAKASKPAPIKAKTEAKTEGGNGANGKAAAKAPARSRAKAAPAAAAKQAS